VAGDNTVTPIRCTQNPTMGEEWRKGWHPERIAPRKSDSKILIVGAGPTGLEAARALGQRGYEVHLAEGSTELGGRVSRESSLPGLAEWARVRDWRLGQINAMPNVHVYLDSPMGASEILDFGADHVLLATGCHWRRDGFGRSNGMGIKGFDHAAIFTPDDIMNGMIPEGPVVVFDDDYFYYASTIADQLCAKKRAVYYVTPDDSIASWSSNTLDYRHIQARMHALGVEQIVASNITEFKGDRVLLQHVWSGKASEILCGAVVTITARLPRDAVYQELMAVESKWSDAGIQSVKCAGDALAPGLIAHAVYAGHRYARELDEERSGDVPFRRHLHTSFTD
jgi:dimethylamine/trimethylamine dehydrogenase